MWRSGTAPDVSQFRVRPRSLSVGVSASRLTGPRVTLPFLSGEIDREQKKSALPREAGAGRRLRAPRRGPVRRLSACGGSCARAAKAKPAAVVVVKVRRASKGRAQACWMTL
jgi:hypothetical protein